MSTAWTSSTSSPSSPPACSPRRPRSRRSAGDSVKDALRIAGFAGLVLLLFGLVSFAFSGSFDLWTAVHIAGGGVLVLMSMAGNVSGVLRAVSARNTRQRAAAVTGTAVFVALLVTVNVLAARFPKSWDATESK